MNKAEKPPCRNLWQALTNPEVEWLMMHCATPEETLCNEYSDYERFRFFCRFRHRLIHTQASLQIRLLWEEQFGESLPYPPLFADDAVCKLLWQEGNRLLGCMGSEEESKRFGWHNISDEKEKINRCLQNEVDCVEKYSFLPSHDSAMLSCSTEETLRFLLENSTYSEACKRLKEKEYSLVCFDLDCSRYLRPDPYRAEKALQAIKSDEKCDIQTISVVLYGLLMFLLREKKRGKIQTEILLHSRDFQGNMVPLLDDCVRLGLGDVMICVGDGEEAAWLNHHPTYRCGMASAVFSPRDGRLPEVCACEVAEVLPIGALVRRAALLETLQGKEWGSVKEVLLASWNTFLSEDLRKK